MWFKRCAKTRLNELQQQIETINKQLLSYKQDSSYMPNTQDIEQFHYIISRLHENHATALYVLRCMKQRHEGKPEGAGKYHNSDIENYHFSG